jgi:hypothetical protein
MPEISTGAAKTPSDSIKPARPAVHRCVKVMKVSKKVLEIERAFFYVLIFSAAADRRNRVCEMSICTSPDDSPGSLLHFGLMFIHRIIQTGCGDRGAWPWRRCHFAHA